MIHIVLLEPEIPANTGNIGRTCVAAGARLHLIGPMGFQINEKQVRRAGLDYWDYLDITRYPSLEDFLDRARGEELFFFTTKGRQLHSQACYPDPAWLVFGREDAGLPEERLLRRPDRCLRLPMRPGLRSLNLSNTVAVAAYEVLRQWDYPELQNAGRLHQYRWEDAPRV